MSEADGVKAEVQNALNKQEAASAFLRLAKIAVDELVGIAMSLGIQESGSSSNARPVLQIGEQTQVDIDQGLSDLTLIRADLLEWMDRL